MKKNVSLFLALILMLAVFPFKASAATSFPDVPSTFWGYYYVTALANKGLIAGYPDGAFGPNRNITRAELVTIVIKSVFGDQPVSASHWAEKYMQKAVDSNLLLPDEFARDTWNTDILRQDIALVAARAMEFLLNEPPATDTDSLTAKITDWNTTSEVKKPYIAQVYAKGIVGGYPDGSFGGGKTATRAEASTMLTKLFDKSYRSAIIGGVSFNPKTDVLPDGKMSVSKSKEYLDIILDNLCFYKEDGKHYVKGYLPELPEGFMTFLKIDWYSPEGSSMYKTRFYENIPEYGIPSTGEIHGELKNITDVSKFTMFTVYIFIDTISKGSYNQNSVGYIIPYERDNEIRVNEYLNTDNENVTKGYWMKYDFSKLFTW